MEKTLLALVVVLAICFSAAPCFAEPEKGKSGEELFKQHCAVCHPDGGNIVNPQFTLHKKDREAHGVKTAADIVSKMRNPGQGMTQFDKKTIPDKDAKKIAEYVLKTFK